MKKLLLSILASFLLVPSLIVPASLSAKSRSFKGDDINWSVNINKQQDSLRLTLLNLGLISNIRHQRGLGLNLFYGAVHETMSGVHMSSLLNYANTANGLQIGGLANLDKQNANGLMVSGLINAIGGTAKGVQISGLTNIAGEQMDGVSIAGLMNISGEVMNGVQLSALMNANSGTLKGVQASVLNNLGVDVRGVQSSMISNIASQNIRGLQLAGVANIAYNVDRALQFSPLTNVCISNMNGMQFGLGNYAENVKGTQVGMLNLSTGKVDGWQIGLVNHSKDTTAHKIGLVNITPRTRIQAMIFGSNTTKINVAVRFKNSLNYSILGIGTHYFDMNDDFSGCLFYRTGLYFPLKNRFEISGDLGYFHIENFEDEHAETPDRLYSLQARLNLSYRILPKLSVFATTGYAMTRHYKKNKLFENKGIIECGIILF